MGIYRMRMRNCAMYGYLSNCYVVGDLTRWKEDRCRAGDSWRAAGGQLVGSHGYDCCQLASTFRFQLEAATELHVIQQSSTQCDHCRIPFSHKKKSHHKRIQPYIKLSAVHSCQAFSRPSAGLRGSATEHLHLCAFFWASTHRTLSQVGRRERQPVQRTNQCVCFAVGSGRLLRPALLRNKGPREGA